MKKLFLAAVTAVFMCLTFTGCVSVVTSGFGGVTGTGELQRYHIEAAGFTSVDASLAANIEYCYAENISVTLDIQPNLMEYIETEVRNGEFIIKSSRGFNITAASKTPVLTINAPYIDGLAIAGAGSFITRDVINTESFSLALSGAGSGEIELNTDKLMVSISGAGSYDITGRADTANIAMSGAGSMNGRGLQTKNADISLSGVGSVTIACSDNLYAQLSGMGSIDYIGSPVVDIKKNGMGSVKQVR